MILTLKIILFLKKTMVFSHGNDKEKQFIIYKFAILIFTHPKKRPTFVPLEIFHTTTKPTSPHTSMNV